MGGGGMSSLRTTMLHLRVRGLATATSAGAAVTVLTMVAAAVWFGPRLTPGAAATGPAELMPGPLGVLIWVLWLWLWPALPVAAVAGRGTGSAPPLPALPLGTRGRALAEAAVVLASLIAGWAVAGAAGAITSAGVAWWMTVVQLVPTTVAWALPARSLEEPMYRSLAVAAVLGCGRGMGLFERPEAAAVWSLGVAALVVLVGTWRPPVGAARPRARRPVVGSRPARAPRVQLNHDLWSAPLSQSGGWMAAAALLLAAAVVLDAAGRLPEWGFLVAANLFLVAALQLVLRPFGSDLLMAGLAGRRDARRGDFLAAFARLPVSRVAVLRRVWLHGAVGSLAAWLVVVLAVVVRARLVQGRFAFLDAAGGDVSGYVGWALMPVPMLAGLLVVAADGRRVATTVALLAIVLSFQTLLLTTTAMALMGLPPGAVEAGAMAFQAALLIAAALPATTSLVRSEP